nr:MAG TPA: hypothetical protein [Caudoviricetes sp.]
MSIDTPILPNKPDTITLTTQDLQERLKSHYRCTVIKYSICICQRAIHKNAC